MGQRTVIVVKKVDRFGKTSLRLVHHQWGFGKTMPSMLMQEFLACIYNNNKNKYTSKLKDFFNFSDSKNNLYSCRGLKSSQNIFDKKFLEKVENRIDNNNGAMLVEVKEEPIDSYDRGYVNIEDVKISFVLGHEECNYNYDLGVYIDEEPFTRLVSAREYMEKTGGERYCPNEFIEMFESFCKFWDIKEIIDNCKVL